MKITRISAFAIHLTLSLLVFSSLIAILYLYWFPGQLFWIDGGWAGLKLVALVDLVLGPLLTLLLFSPGKKGLKFDMCAIAAFQVAALAYGFYATHQQQTRGLVFADGEFQTLSYSGHIEANNKLVSKGETPKSLSDFGSSNPINVFIPPPSKETMGRYLVDIFNGYPDPLARSDKFEPIVDNHDKLQEFSLDQESLAEVGAWSDIETMLKRKKLNASDVEIYRFSARFEKGFAIFSPAQMQVIAYVPFVYTAEKSTVAENEED